MIGRLFAASILAALVASTSFAADPPKLPDVKEFDKTVDNTLREVHNVGAELFNESKEYSGTYRMYQGALLTVRPLLAHRPAAQKMIDDGFTAAAKEPLTAMKAFKLHEAIEAVRSSLKNPVTTEPGPKKEPNPMPKTEPKKEPKTEPKKEPNPNPKKEPNPNPKKEPNPADTGKGGASLSGVVRLNGEPLKAADITAVSLDLAKPRVFSTTSAETGRYAFKEALPASRYVVMVSGKDVPVKFTTTTTSGLVIDVKPSGGTFDLNLK